VFASFEFNYAISNDLANSSSCWNFSILFIFLSLSSYLITYLRESDTINSFSRLKGLPGLGLALSNDETRDNVFPFVTVLLPNRYVI
jgi:hypothetical protein